MTMPLRQLPVIQKWECNSCTHCCREYDVVVSEEERKTITEQGWHDDPEVGQLPLFVRQSWWSDSYTLNHRPDGRCVFLNDENRCRIHEKYGAEAKPLACRLFPFVLIPVDDHWRVGVRYACPSAAENKGPSLRKQIDAVSSDVAQFENRHQEQLHDLKPPPLQQGVKVEWTDLRRSAKALQNILETKEERFERRLRKCLALAKSCRDAKLNEITGPTLSEFLQVMSVEMDDETPEQPSQVLAPSWPGRMLFRQLLSVYVRKDRGVYKGNTQRGRWTTFLANCRFALGTGEVPMFNNLIRDVTFEELALPSASLTPEEEQLFERYYLVKIKSLQFFGATNFRFPFWDGFEALSLIFPMSLWLSRAISEQPNHESLTKAISLIDDHFGWNPILGRGWGKRAVRILRKQGDIARLIAWYGR
ncbi:MAG: YkgJ family cysteine cluster protein [Gemmataceae bacterium]